MKLFRKIRRKFIEESQLKKYLLYSVGEIILVMLGILLAFQVNNWNDNRVKMKTEMRHYNNIRNQIIDDKEAIDGQMKYNLLYISQFDYANQIIEKNDRSQIDTLGRIAINLIKYSDFDRHGNIYESLVNSGEIKLLNNQKIVENLRRLEERYIYINRMENIHFEALLKYAASAVISSISLSSGNVQKPNKLYSFEFQNLFIMFIGVMQEKDEIYKKAIIEIETLIELIDRNLKSNNQ